MRDLTGIAGDEWRDGSLCLYHVGRRNDRKMLLLALIRRRQLLDATSFINFWEAKGASVLQMLETGQTFDISLNIKLFTKHAQTPVECQMESTAVPDSFRLPVSRHEHAMQIVLMTLQLFADGVCLRIVSAEESHSPLKSREHTSSITCIVSNCGKHYQQLTRVCHHSSTRSSSFSGLQWLSNCKRTTGTLGVHRVCVWQSH